MRTRPRYALSSAIIIGLAVSVAATQSPPATSPAPTTSPVLDPEIDKILTRLEQREVHDLRASAAWRQRYVIDDEEDAVTKTGELWHKQTEPVAKFLIRFTAKVASGRKDDLDERHMFDGCWYTEVQSRTKTVTRREVRRPDDPGDPYKVGEGVFPLPFGQKKADILRTFEVERVAATKQDPPATDHLRLVPRAGTQTGETYKTLDFWVSREGKTAGLPLKVQVAKKDGTGRVNSYITITFSDARLNEGFSESIFEIKTPAGYEEIVERLEAIAAPVGGESPQAP